MCPSPEEASSSTTRSIVGDSTPPCRVIRGPCCCPTPPSHPKSAAHQKWHDRHCAVYPGLELSGCLGVGHLYNKKARERSCPRRERQRYHSGSEQHVVSGTPSNLINSRAYASIQGLPEATQSGYFEMSRRCLIRDGEVRSKSRPM